jgi:hypothetical protein
VESDYDVLRDDRRLRVRRHIAQSAITPPTAKPPVEGSGVAVIVQCPLASIPGFVPVTRTSSDMFPGPFS